MRMWEWTFAYRLLRSGNTLYQSFSLFCLLGVAVVVAGFIATFAIFSGFDHAYTDAIVRFNGSAVLLKAGGLAPSDEALTRIAGFALPSGRASEFRAVPFYYGETLAFAGREMKGVQVKAVDALHWAEAIASYRPHPRSATSFAQGVYVGGMLDRELGHPQTIRLLKMNPGGLEKKSSARALVAEFPVEGTFDTGLSEFDGVFILMKAEAYRALGGSLDRFHGVELYPTHAVLISDKTLAALRDLFSYPYTFMDWRELNGVFFDALKLERTVFLLIASAVMGIAVLDLMILAMIQMVEKTREWLLLEVLGAEMAARRRFFFKQIFLLAVIGLLLGWALGAGLVFALVHWISIPLSAELYFLEKLPIVWSWLPFIQSGAMLVLASAFAIAIALRVGKFLQRKYRLH